MNRTTANIASHAGEADFNPEWIPLVPCCPGGPPRHRAEREAERRAIAACGRKWTPRHRIVAMKWLMKWGVITSSELNDAIDDWKADRDRARQIRREAGLQSPHGFRIW